MSTLDEIRARNEARVACERGGCPSFRCRCVQRDIDTLLEIIDGQPKCRGDYGHCFCITKRETTPALGLILSGRTVHCCRCGLREGCTNCGHEWGSHNYDKDGHELPDSGPCNECDCKEFK